MSWLDQIRWWEEKKEETHHDKWNFVFTRSSYRARKEHSHQRSWLVVEHTFYLVRSLIKNVKKTIGNLVFLSSHRE